MTLNAKDVLRAIRMKHSADAVVHEVVIRDEAQQRIYRKFLQEAHPRIYTDAHYAERGEVVADSVPEGWIPKHFERRIDALIFNGNTSVTACEIKVTRPDFFKDTSEKRGPWIEHSNRFVYVTPKGLVEPSEVPFGCGLWEVDPDRFNPDHRHAHGITAVKRATVNKNPRPLPSYVLTAFAYRLSNIARKETK